MRPPVHVDVADPAAFAGENDFVLRHREMHAARVRVDEERPVAAARTAEAGLRNGNIRITFFMRGPRTAVIGRCTARATTTAAATTPACARHRNSRFEPRRRNAATETSKTTCAIRVRAHPGAFEAFPRGRRLLTHGRG